MMAPRSTREAPQTVCPGRDVGRGLEVGTREICLHVGSIMYLALRGRGLRRWWGLRRTGPLRKPWGCSLPLPCVRL